ncbi:MAG: YifB family Mg chelatase-like AAA ATPase [Lactobacillaceae bacterium]|jgi:magnesium chelatase family protein|nr:YifB family Mg chelatase-like AAA ATPase [Lactobacillaceae bacterium]
MLAKINTIAFNGLEILDVDLQIQISSGLPAFTIVGLPDKAVAESKERVRAALNSLGLSLPAKRITINLAPADLLKEGSHYDLPVALSLLVGIGVLPQEELNNYIAAGELGLDGGIIKINGILPVAIHANSKNMGLICPQACGGEAAWSGLKDIIAADSLLSIINHFKGSQIIPYPQTEKESGKNSLLDMADVKGQETAKRALEIAAAGAHNLLMIGPPGSGKSMLASRLTSILPSMSTEEALETSIIHSIAGELKNGKLDFSRPYRNPHHNASTPALVGGGRKGQPGEISLSHNGVLFLDELPEFARPTLEALRQPLENGEVSISRVSAHTKYPAKFQLIAAMNPCRCGNLGSTKLECSKAPKCAEEYQAKISGPLLDRIDMQIEVPAVSPWDISNTKKGESSAEILKRVTKAREIQKKRFEEFGIKNLRTNSELTGDLLETATCLDSSTKSFLIDVANKMNMSARAYHRILRVARTIADLQNEIKVINIHVAEAISYRRFIASL